MDAKQMASAIPAASQGNPSLARVLRHLVERIETLEEKTAKDTARPEPEEATE